MLPPSWVCLGWEVSIVSKELVFGIASLFGRLRMMWGAAASCDSPLPSCFLSCPNPKQILREMVIVVGCLCTTLQYNIAFFYTKHFRLS